MPELPEVETVRRGLAPAMEGAVIAAVELNRPNLRFPFPENFAERLKNRSVISVARRAKYLMIYLDNDNVLVMHLGMSGSFHVEKKDKSSGLHGNLYHDRDRLDAHDHVILHLERDVENFRITYNDPRRFGYMELISADRLNEHKYFADLGVEPTGNSLDGELLNKLFTGRKAPLKAALLDQKLIAGLGNIYVCEALWQARLSPRRQAKTICSLNRPATARSHALSDAVRDVIGRAIEAGGSSLSDHRRTDGTLGYFQHRFNVYDREGETCKRPDCKGVIKRIVQSGRSTYFCASCQK